MKKYRLLIIVTAVCAGIASCKKKEAPPSSPPPAEKKKADAPPPVQAKMSSAVPPPVSSVDFTGKKDPFRPYVVPKKVEKPPVAAGTSIPLRNRGDLLPIQRFDVEQFKVIGIVTGLKENWALAVDPAGKSYVLKEGMLIGGNNGKISKITAGGVEVRERYRTDTGKMKDRTVRMTLSRKQ